ncbi:unnamed protein product [Cunninghamella blakesleeana]
MNSPPFNVPVPPTLTEPNKTLTSDKQPFRRPSLYQDNSSSPISPSSPPYLSSTITNTISELPDTLTTINNSFSSVSIKNNNKPLPTLPSITHSPTPTSSTNTYSTANTQALKHTTQRFNNIQYTAVKNFCSTSILDINDIAFWSTLLNNNKYIPTHSPQDAFDLEMDTVGLSIDLAANNMRTRNFTKLVLHLLSQILIFQESETLMIPTSTYNALFLVRVFSKHFVGNMTNDEIIAQFEGTCPINHKKNDYADLDPNKLYIHPKVENDKRPKAEQLMDAILTLIVNMDPNTDYSTYEFYVELLNTLLVLFSTQLHHNDTKEPNYFLDLLLNQFGNRTDALLAKLLDNIIENKPPPPQSSSVVYSAYNYFFAPKASSTDVDPLPVADRSLLLILLLSTQSNQYRKAISGLRDHHVLQSTLENQETKIHLISFKDLFNVISQSLHIEERMLLFYLILVENESFRVYILSRTDPETIYIPILKMIYESVENRTNFSQMYILMIILLIFSQDEVNNETIQKVMVNHLTWFTERPLLKSVSLGGLTVLVLIRTVLFNLSHQKDIYFHTNCLAILANMSSSMLDMHAYVAQRLTGVFELIARRYQKWLTKKQETGELPHTAVDISVYEDLLMLMLETFNSILIHRLKNNTQLVYALLLKREIFIPFRLQSRFIDVINNIESVINYFHARVSEANLKSPSTNEVLDLIEQATRTWPSNRLSELPDLKFQYEEEQDANDFFVPYVWALIHRRTFVYWSEEKAHILDAYRVMNTHGTATDNDNDDHHTTPHLPSSSSNSSIVTSPIP